MVDLTTLVLALFLTKLSIYSSSHGGFHFRSCLGVLGPNCKFIRLPTKVFNLGRSRWCLGVFGPNCKFIRLPTMVFNLERCRSYLGVFVPNCKSIRLPTKVFNIG